MKRADVFFAVALACAVPQVLATVDNPHAPPMRNTTAADASATVYTRGALHSLSKEEDGRQATVRIKILPGNAPFTTLTYRLPDRRLAAGLREGAEVAFIARRIDGENTVTDLRPIAQCPRFPRCD